MAARTSAKLETDYNFAIYGLVFSNFKAVI